jgi:hypothetical protein
MNQQIYTAVIQQREGWRIGWMEEISGVNAQERTREELLTSLRECLAEAITMNREEAIAAAGEHWQEETIAMKRELGRRMLELRA